ncbi:hypothetical protein GCM10009772_11930 [Pseudonocardia alni subsp. carboxydivorans]
MGNASCDTAPVTTTAALIGRELGPLRRTLLRRTRIAADLPDLSEAQIELLRTLAAEGPLAPSELAAALRLARSTVSNLLRTLTAAGFVERRAGANQRTVVVTVSARAAGALERYDAAAEALLGAALDRLAPAERAALAAAAPVLARLTGALDAG